MMDFDFNSTELLNDIFSQDQDGLASRALFEGFTSGWDRLIAMIKSLDMKGVLAFLMTLTAFVTSENATQAIQGLGQNIQKEIQAIKQPIDETIAYIGSSQCANVKKLIGVAYEQLEGEREPDLTKLTLVYKTKSFSKIFNISTAAASVRQARGLEKQKLVIFVHGFIDDPTKNSFRNISESFLQSAEGAKITLLALDGSSLIRWLYLRATSYVQFMGYAMAEVLVAMVQSGLEPSQIHMVGHSLGAHISGFAGKRFQQLTGQRIGRITGMDPAGPCFAFVNDTYRLSEADADFVDVIHTDAGVYGIRDPVGHADYYPNGGSMQPDCFFQTCSHSRAWQLFGVSVLNKTILPAVRCASYEAFKKGRCEDIISYMGYPSEPGTRGLFFLQTDGKYPYGKGLEGLKYKNDDALVKTFHEELTKNRNVLDNLPGLEDRNSSLSKNLQDEIAKKISLDKLPGLGGMNNKNNSFVKNVQKDLTKNIPSLGNVPDLARANKNNFSESLKQEDQKKSKGILDLPIFGK